MRKKNNSKTVKQAVKPVEVKKEETVAPVSYTHLDVYKRQTDNSGNLIANIFLHLFLPVGIGIAPIVGGRPYWVIKDYVPDLFIVSFLSVVLLAIGGILKLKNRRNS